MCFTSLLNCAISLQEVVESQGGLPTLYYTPMRDSYRPNKRRTVCVKGILRACTILAQKETKILIFFFCDFYWTHMRSFVQLISCCQKEAIFIVRAQRSSLSTSLETHA
uniref:Uncharacterized protein n=1 Tax=Lepeophtheirus salmonis TaxID=72036 RepID=A0A0K2U1F5_LEPSM